MIHDIYFKLFLNLLSFSKSEKPFIGSCVNLNVVQLLKLDMDLILRS